MASPFKVFRKNQKVMLAVIGVLAMFAFVFIGPWSRLGDHSPKVENPEVFTWDSGTVRESDMRGYLAMRRVVRGFLTYAAELAGSPPQQVRMELDRQFPETEQAIINAMLLAKKGSQLGIVVSDDAINRFIKAWTQNRVPREQLAVAIAEMRSDRGRISEAHLFDDLRFELTAMYTQALVFPLLMRSDTPSDCWSAYSKLNRKVTAEIMPVAVEKFADGIADPPAEVLNAFYNQFKNQFPIPDQPTPGFREPYKAQFQYLKADYEKFMAAELPKVTDDEIKEYYEKYKDVFFRKPPELESRNGEGAATSGSTSAEQPNDAKGTAGSSDAKSDAKSDTKSDKKSEAPSDSKSSTGKSKGAATDKSGATKSGAKGSTSTPSTDTKSKGTAPKDSGKSGKESPDNKQSRSEQVDSLDGELLAFADTGAPGAKTESPAAAPETKNSATEAPAAKSDEAKPDLPPVEYEPLDKVTDTIRNRIASEKFAKKVDDAFIAIRAPMDEYRNQMARYRADVAAGIPNLKKPEPIDLAALAEKQGLEYRETDLLTAQQAYDSTGGLGQSRTLLAAGSYNALPFVRIAFTPSLLLFQAEQTEDIENNRYLWWKIADQPSRTPPLDEIKDKVTRAWKLIQARTPAKAKADEYATQAKRTRQKLKDAFENQPGLEVSTAGPFSWLTRQLANPDGLPTLSEVSGVQGVGDEFMRAVFALPVGDAGVATNQAQSTYYVVQIESEEPTSDELHESFMTAMSNPTTSRLYSIVNMMDRRQEMDQWMADLKQQFGFRANADRPISETRTAEASF